MDQAMPFQPAFSRKGLRHQQQAVMPTTRLQLPAVSAMARRFIGEFATQGP